MSTTPFFYRCRVFTPRGTPCAPPLRVTHRTASNFNFPLPRTPSPPPPLPTLNVVNTTKDADRMTSLWMPSNDVMCIHPGDEPVMGQQAVARSWRLLFRSGDSRFSSSVIKVSICLRKADCASGMCRFPFQAHALVVSWWYFMDDMFRVAATTSASEEGLEEPLDARCSTLEQQSLRAGHGVFS